MSATEGTVRSEGSRSSTSEMSAEAHCSGVGPADSTASTAVTPVDNAAKCDASLETSGKIGVEQKEPTQQRRPVMQLVAEHVKDCAPGEFRLLRLERSNMLTALPRGVSLEWQLDASFGEILNDMNGSCDSMAQRRPANECRPMSMPPLRGGLTRLPVGVPGADNLGSFGDLRRSGRTRKAPTRHMNGNTSGADGDSRDAAKRRRIASEEPPQLPLVTRRGATHNTAAAAPAGALQQQEPPPRRNTRRGTPQPGHPMQVGAAPEADPEDVLAENSRLKARLAQLERASKSGNDKAADGMDENSAEEEEDEFLPHVGKRSHAKARRSARGRGAGRGAPSRGGRRGSSPARVTRQTGHVGPAAAGLRRRHGGAVEEPPPKVAATPAAQRGRGAAQRKRNTDDFVARPRNAEAPQHTAKASARGVATQQHGATTRGAGGHRSKGGGAPAQPQPLSQEEKNVLQGKINTLEEAQLDRVLAFLEQDIDGTGEDIELDLDTLPPTRQRALVEVVDGEIRSLERTKGSEATAPSPAFPVVEPGTTPLGAISPFPTEATPRSEHRQVVDAASSERLMRTWEECSARELQRQSHLREVRESASAAGNSTPGMTPGGGEPMFGEPPTQMPEFTLPPPAVANAGNNAGANAGAGAAGGAGGACGANHGGGVIAASEPVVGGVAEAGSGAASAAVRTGTTSGGAVGTEAGVGTVGCSDDSMLGVTAEVLNMMDFKW
eukprot:TRINITY_DN12784_c0_g1_i2.p1 TRINITY_DN12784_c0_g1~~TRINITY_DN12784_c0_g1_i2.p1  ORF type:complete len:724 (+),score=155.76 TRINITY_DN12784_c0_g1_i2:97-2268(+)